MRDLLDKLVARMKSEPVRALALLVAALVVGVAAATGTDVSVVVAEVTAILAAAEKVRDAVTPVLDSLAERNH